MRKGEIHEGPGRLNSVVVKLCKYNLLSASAVHAMNTLLTRTRQVPIGKEIIAAGEDADRDVWALVDGWASRYLLRPNGDRQIVGLMTPGDFCDFRDIRLSVRHFEIVTLTPATVVHIPRAQFNAVLDEHRDIVLAFAKAQLADESIMQMWIANMASKRALQRTAHLLCELVARVSRSTDQTTLDIEFPLAQSDLAYILGMSVVHVNRVLQSLRAEDLIRLQSHRLQVNDYPKLAKIAQFDPSYLYYGEGRATADLT